MQQSRELIEEVYRLVRLNKPIRAQKKLKSYLQRLTKEERVNEFFWVLAQLDLNRLDPTSASNVGILRTQFLGGIQRSQVYEA